MSSVKLVPVLILKIAFFTAATTVAAEAAVFTVTKTADPNDGVGAADCSVREAIAAVNASASASMKM